MMHSPVYLPIFLLAFPLTPVASFGFNDSSVNAFLESWSINPLEVSTYTKRAGGTTLACAVFHLARGDETVTAMNSSSYTKEREAHWSPTAWEYPSCIFTPTGTAEVVFAVQVLGFTRSKYAIRSGGHSPLPLWASIDDGVLISMSSIIDINYTAATETVRMGFGLVWGDVYDYLEPYNRLVVGGRVSPVGLGLTIGGGLSHLSNRYGFSADNVLSFEIVLANATSVIADKNKHSELYWALKGGSNNFGIVTHMTLKAYPAGKVWGGTITYNESHQDALMNAFAEYQHVGQLDQSTATITYMLINNGTLAVTLVYFGSAQRPDAFQPFYDIPALSDMTALHDNLTDLIDEPLNQGVPRYTWGSTTIYVDNTTYVDVARICKEQTTHLENINGGSLILLPQPISKTMIDASQTSGGNVMGLRSRPQLWFTINIGWNLASDDAKAYSLMTSILEKVEDLTKSRNLYDPFVFLNDAFTTQPVIHRYGEANLERLQYVSKLYDPGRMFQDQVPGGFKLVN